jgi:hypothetical protein
LEASNGIDQALYEVLEDALGVVQDVLDNTQALLGGGTNPLPYIQYDGVLTQNTVLVNENCSAGMRLETTGELAIYSPAKDVGQDAAKVWSSGVPNTGVGNCTVSNSVTFNMDGTIGPTGGGACQWPAGPLQGGQGYISDLKDDCNFEIATLDGPTYDTGFLTGKECHQRPKGVSPEDFCPSGVGGGSTNIEIDDIGCKGSFGDSNNQVSCTIVGVMLGKKLNNTVTMKFPPTLSSIISSLMNVAEDIFNNKS